MMSHIVKSFDDELTQLNTMISSMGKEVCQHIEKAVKAVVESDSKLALEIIEEDPLIDEAEHKIDAFAVRLLALRQPVASDLRHVIMSIKVSSHLERIADYTANISRRAIALEKMIPVPAVHAIPRMAKVTQEMVADVVKAYTHADNDAAQVVWKRDVEVDEMYVSLLRELLTYMMEDPRNISPATQLLFVGKYLERIGDHATNIAESVHYLVHGTLFTAKRTKLNEVVV